jgi:hypothetical protein
MKTRKLLAIVLAVAMLASFVSIPVFADGHEGEALETLGILIGEGDGVTEDYLASMATRAQAALIHLRLLGLEADALAFEGEDTFADAALATEFWQPVLEYLYANPSVGWQGDGVNFMPTEYVTGQMFTKVLLVALGYVEDVDFTWETVMAFAETVGLTALADKADADLTVEDLAVALIEALGTKTTAPTDVTLLTQLVLDGVIDEADAVAAGFEVGEEALVVVDAYASAVDTVMVEMSTDVPEDAVITLKKGTASYAVSEAVDGNMITLTALFTLPAGTYTVTVDGSSADFEVVAQHAVDLVIGADTLYLADGQDLKVSMLDQYGDAMPLSGTNYSIFNQADGFVYDPTVTTTFKIDLLFEGDAEAGDTIYVFVYDPVSMLTVSGELPVIAAPYLETLAVGGVTIGDEDASMLFEWEADNMLAVTGYDQYGQEITLTDSMFTTAVPYDYTAEVQVLSSNGGVLDPDDIDIDGGKFYFDTSDPGTAMFTFIIPDQAFIVTSEMITVYADPEVASVEIAGPAGPLYAEEAAEFAVAGFDQYGAPIDVSGGVTFTVTHDVFSSDPALTGTNKGSLTFGEAGTSTVYYFLNGIFQGTFDVMAEAAAYPFQIVAVDTWGGLEEGVCTNIMSADIEVIDQYGRSYDDRGVNPFADGEYNFMIMTAAATDLFHIHNNSWSSNGFDICANTGYDTGSATFVAKLLKWDWQVMTESAFTFDVMNVETEDVDGFAMGAIAGPMYTEDVFDYGQSAENYHKTVTVSGKYGDLSVKLYDDNSDGLPDLIDIVTTSVDQVEVMTDNILAPNLALAGATGTMTVKAWRNGVAVAMTDVDLSNVDPDCVTITPVADGDGTDSSDSFTFKDQYGVGLVYDLLQASRSGDDPNWYFYGTDWTDSDYYYLNLVKWDGSISATYIETLD